MHPLASLLVIILPIVGVLSTIKCPLNETEWKTRSETKGCQGSDVYHCLLAEDGKTRKERCIEKTLIMGGHCPIVTHDDYLHWKTCNRTGCPSIPFRSDEVYNYPVCFGEIESQKLSGSEDNVVSSKIGIPLGIVAAVLVIMATCIVIFKKRRQMTCLSRFWRNNDTDNDDPELGKLIKKPEYISIGIDQLQARNILYVIGQLGNSVSTAGKKITKKYAKRHKMSCEYYNYLDVSDKLSALGSEKVFKPRSVNFIDGWGGLWNENPCERRGTLDTIAKIIEQSKTIENRKFVIGLRTEVRDSLRNDLSRLEIRMSENETVLLDSSSIYKRKKVREKIKMLQKSCSNNDCNCKSLNFEQVSGIVQVPIGIYLVVKLMSLDHAMIGDFLKEDIGPLKAMRDHFEGLMEGEQIWSWLPYFVCLGYYDKKEFRQEIADGFDISQNTLSGCERIAKYTKSIPKLAPMWSTRFSLLKDQDKEPRNVLVFWHNFLYICAFHACYKKYPKQIMRFCNLDAILQLVRPQSRPDPLTIEASNEEIDDFCEERLKTLADDSLLSDHPLIQDWKNRKRNLNDIFALYFQEPKLSTS